MGLSLPGGIVQMKTKVIIVLFIICLILTGCEKNNEASMPQNIDNSACPINSNSIDVPIPGNDPSHKDFVSFLKENINDSLSLSDIVNVFERMCREPIPEDMILYETGTYSFTGEPFFFFSLVRQFPNGDGEYYQIHVDILYKPNSKNQIYTNAVWNEDIDGDFFDYIRNSKAFGCASSEDIVKINIYQDET